MNKVIVVFALAIVVEIVLFVVTLPQPEVIESITVAMNTEGKAMGDKIYDSAAIQSHAILYGIIILGTFLAGLLTYQTNRSNSD